ncbi:MAG: DUF342 domain-containing protein [Desulfobacterales bacterium]|nr:DUF342 domain-containing protein [Desulfobacterales bacterium]MCP4160278.1 DUF342 domain-containing protein [Deltaproteobacteria bacterium]
MFRTMCPSCQHVYKITEANVDKVVSCKNCKFIFLIERLKNENPIPIVIQLGINKKKITSENINEILAFHKNNKNNQSINEFLLQKKILNEKELSLLLIEARTLDDKLFIKTILNEAIVNKEDIKEALKFQENSKKKGKHVIMRDALLKLGIISKKQMQRMFAKQYSERKRLLDVELKKEHQMKDKVLEETSNKVNEENQTLPPQIKSDKGSENKLKQSNAKYDYKNDLELSKFGVLHNFIKKDHLDEVIEIRKKNKISKSLIQILIAKNYITSKKALQLKTFKEFGTVRDKDNLFGQMAIRKGLLKKEDVKRALDKQISLYKEKDQIKRIGDFLIEDKIINEENKDIVITLQEESDNIRADKLKKGTKDEEKQNVTSEKADSLENFLEKTEKKVEVDELTLEVEEGNLTAYLYLPDDKSKVSLLNVKGIVDSNEIIYGVTNDEIISNILKSNTLKTNKFIIAKGEDSVNGVNGSIEYFFNTDYLTAGEIKEDGSIDFKERGETPFVKEGGLIAVKTPPIQGKHGKDIYDFEILCTEANDPPLKLGNGVNLSEDKLSVVASIEGRPDLSVSGVLSVFNEVVIPDNVDYNTGNIDFKGNINIRGTILEGFSVQGVNVTTLEVEGGMIRVTNDFNVSGGIIESDVFVEGITQAMFVRKSRVFCFGDVIISKEIIDSEIITSGKCIIERGSIFNSKISAKKGIVALQIGNERTDQNKIRIGVDDHITQAVELYELEIASYEEKVKLQHRIVKKNEKEIDDLLKSLVKSTNRKDKLTKDKEVLKTKMKPDNQEEIVKKINSLDETLEQLKESIDENNKSLKECEIKTEETEKQIEVNEKFIEEIMVHKDGSIDWAKKQSGFAEIKVLGSIALKTLVFTRNSRLELSETQRVCYVKEINNKLRYDSKERFERNIPDYELTVVSDQKKFSKE